LPFSNNYTLIKKENLSQTILLQNYTMDYSNYGHSLKETETEKKEKRKAWS